MQVRITGQKKKKCFFPLQGCRRREETKSPLQYGSTSLWQPCSPTNLHHRRQFYFYLFPEPHLQHLWTYSLLAALLTMGSFDLYMERTFPKENISWAEAQHCSSLQPDAGKTTFSTQIMRVHGSEVNKVCKMEVGSKRLMRCVKTKGNDPWLMSVCQHTIKCPELLC